MTKSSSGSERDSREKLLEAAKGVFARKGYDGATVKELADAAELNVSLVSYYFGGKEGLYKACLEQAGKGRLSVAERILVGPTSLEDMTVRLGLFVEDIFQFHIDERDVGQIIQRDCGMPNPATREVFAQTFLKIFDRLIEFLHRAQKSGFLKKDLDVEISCRLIFGAITSMVRFDEMSKEFYGKSIENKAYRERVVHQITHELIEGMIAAPNRK